MMLLKSGSEESWSSSTSSKDHRGEEEDDNKEENEEAEQDWTCPHTLLQPGSMVMGNDNMNPGEIMILVKKKNDNQVGPQVTCHHRSSHVCLSR
jgi:hypothetical protein